MPTAPVDVRRGLLQRVRRVFREEGLRGVVRRVVRRFYRRMFFLERSLSEPIAPIESRLPVEIRILREEDLPAYAAFRNQDDANSGRELMAKGDIAFGAWYQGRLVADAWAATRSVPLGELAAEIQIRPGDVYFFDAYTHPDMRGQGLSPALSAYMLRHYREQGLRRAMRATLPANTPALKAHAKSGFRVYSVRTMIRIGRLRRDFKRDLP